MLCISPETFLPSVFLLWWEVFAFMGAMSLQSCLTLCNSMDCSFSGSSVHGVLQARTLEWVAMPSSRGSSWPRDQTSICLLCWQEGSLPLIPPGKPFRTLAHFYIVIWFFGEFKSSMYFGDTSPLLDTCFSCTFSKTVVYLLFLLTMPFVKQKVF